MRTGGTLRVFLRSRWRVLVLSISAIVVVLLILSPSVTISDLQTRDIKELLAKMPYHVQISVNDVPPSSIKDAEASILQVDGVESSAHLAYYQYNALALGYDNVSIQIYYILLAGGDMEILNSSGFRIVAGRMPGEGEIALPADYFNKTLLGSRVSLGIYGTSPFKKLGNYTVVGLFRAKEGSDYSLAPGGPSVLLGSHEFIDKYGSAESAVNFYITVEQSIVNPYDIDLTIENLKELHYRLKEAVYSSIGAHEIYVFDRLQVELSRLKSIYFARTLLLMAFALPYIIVAWYYGIIAGEGILTGLKHYLGTMISRGVPVSLAKRGYFEFVFLISLAGAVGGVFLSVGIGHLVSWTLYGIKSSSFVGFLDSVVASVLAVLTALIIYWRTARRIEEIRPVEAMRLYEPGAEVVERASKLSWALFILGSLKMAEWVSGVTPQDLMRHMGRNTILTMLIVIWLILSSFLQVFAPFFFVYGAAKVLTAHRRSLRAITRLFTRLLGRGDAPLAHRYSSALPRTHSRTAFVGALLVSMMVLSLGLFGTVVDYTDRLSTFLRGSEVSYYWYNGNVTEVEEAVTSLHPEAYLILAYMGTGRVTAPACGVFQQGASVYGIVSGTADAMYWGRADRVSVSGRSPVEVVDSLGSGEAILVAWEDADSLKGCVGGTLLYRGGGVIKYQVPQLEGKEVELRITDVFRALPGVDVWSWVLLLDDRGDSAVTNFYVYLKGVDPEIASQKLVPLGGIERGRSEELSILRGTADWLRIYGIYGSFLALLSVGILSFSAIRNRLYDIAVMRSRGYTPRRAARIAYLIVLPGIAFGLLLGVATGMISLYGYKSVIAITGGIGERLSEVVPLTMHFMGPDLALIGGAIAALLLVPLALSMEAAREKLVKELRGV